MSDPRLEARPHLTRAELNAEYVTDVRWWRLAELEASDAKFAPRRLLLLVLQLVLGGPLCEPVDVGA